MKMKTFASFDDDDDDDDDDGNDDDDDDGAVETRLHSSRSVIFLDSI